MDPKRPWECADMSQVRSEIDRIDAELVDLIAERFGYVDRAWQLKMHSTEGAVVPWRIQQVIDKVKARAEQADLPPEMVEMVGAQWRNMIGWFVQYEEEKLRKVSDPNGDNGGADGGTAGGATP
jgi:isochorismate pyruvate lyase